jgi:hypothetical protein
MFLRDFILFNKCFFYPPNTRGDTVESQDPHHNSNEAEAVRVSSLWGIHCGGNTILRSGFPEHSTGHSDRL